MAATLWRYGAPPPLGIVTFVDASKVKQKRNPGYCYINAGFQLVGRTKQAGLLAFQLLPEAMPEPSPPIGMQLAL